MLWDLETIFKYIHVEQTVKVVMLQFSDPRPVEIYNGIDQAEHFPLAFYK